MTGFTRCCLVLGVGTTLGLALVAVLFRLSENFDTQLIHV